MNDKEINDIISKMTLHEKIMICTGKNSWRTQEYPQYKIPSMLMSDGTNGIRFQINSDKAEPPYFADSLLSSFDSPEALANTHVATCYPSGSAIACAWNKNLMKEMGIQLAKECKSLGIHMLLGPGMNIRRHPLTARNFEYYSEDPCLTGELAAALVNAVQSQGVAASVKHFACHNSDNRRTRVDVTVDERALREIYLAGFERVVKKARPATVMTSYNKINGEEVNESSKLLRDILRKEWGFQGAVITDWGSAKDVSKDTVAGMNLQMPCSLSSAQKLEEDIRNGLIDEKLLDERVFYVLKLVFAYAKEPQEPVINNPEENHMLARKAAEETMVLLKNDYHMLPLEAEKKQKIAVIGRIAKEPMYVGSGCAVVRTESAEIPYEEISKLCKENTEIIYAQGYNRDGSTTEELLQGVAAAAAESDIVLVFAGEDLPSESDMYNRTTMDIGLGQAQMIEVAAKNNNHTAVLLFGGDVVVMPWIESVQAVLAVWYGGEGMGSALAKIIFGEVCPSGKLPVTIPVREVDTPAHLTFHSDHYHMLYGESIYVGYRYYDKRQVEPLYPFGYGMSYTEFQYTNLCILEENSEGVRISVDVENIGSKDGKEIVEVYVAAKGGVIPRPVRELKNFEKIALACGEKKTIEFVLEERDFCCYDSLSEQWVSDAEKYSVEVGASSRDIRLQATVTREKTLHAPKHLQMDCGFHEIFANKETKDMFFDFAAEHQLLDRELTTNETADALEHTFWSVRAFMDMNSHGIVTEAMMDDLIEKMNKQLEG